MLDLSPNMFNKYLFCEQNVLFFLALLLLLTLNSTPLVDKTVF